METQTLVSGTGGANGQDFEGFISKAEVGRRLNMKPRTIDEWMRAGLLPYYKMKHSVRFKWSEIEHHLGQTCRVCRRG